MIWPQVIRASHSGRVIASIRSAEGGDAAGENGCIMRTGQEPAVSIDAEEGWVAVLK